MAKSRSRERRPDHDDTARRGSPLSRFFRALFGLGPRSEAVDPALAAGSFDWDAFAPVSAEAGAPRPESPRSGSAKRGGRTKSRGKSERRKRLTPQELAERRARRAARRSGETRTPQTATADPAAERGGAVARRSGATATPAAAPVDPVADASHAPVDAAADPVRRPPNADAVFSEFDWD